MFLVPNSMASNLWPSSACLLMVAYTVTFNCCSMMSCHIFCTAWSLMIPLWCRMCVHALRSTSDIVTMATQHQISLEHQHLLWSTCDGTWPTWLPMFFKERGYGRCLTYKSLHLLQWKEWQMFVIRELPFYYKARRMEGVSSKGVTLQLRNMAWKGFVIRKFHMLLQEEGVYKNCPSFPSYWIHSFFKHSNYPDKPEPQFHVPCYVYI